MEFLKEFQKLRRVIPGFSNNGEGPGVRQAGWVEILDYYCGEVGISRFVEGGWFRRGGSLSLREGGFGELEWGFRFWLALGILCGNLLY